MKKNQRGIEKKVIVRPGTQKWRRWVTRACLTRAPFPWSDVPVTMVTESFRWETTILKWQQVYSYLCKNMKEKEPWWVIIPSKYQITIIFRECCNYFIEMRAFLLLYHICIKSQQWTFQHKRDIRLTHTDIFTAKLHPPMALNCLTCWVWRRA